MIKGKSNYPVPTGTLLIIGGHENKGASPEKKVEENGFEPLDILSNFVKLINKEECSIAVITTASTEAAATFKDYETAFTKLGVETSTQIHHYKRAQVLIDDAALSTVEKADGVFFSGGDQLRLTAIYGGTKLLTKLKERYVFDKLVLGGTSAGAMALSTPMIYSGNKDVQQISGEIRVTTGLEFLKDVCIDTHFVERGRFIRLAQVVASNPTCIGVGIEEDTAIIVTKGKDAEVIGSGTVVVIDGFSITDSNILNYGSGDKIQVDDLKVNLLSKGYLYELPKINPPHW